MRLRTVRDNNQLVFKSPGRNSKKLVHELKRRLAARASDVIEREPRPGEQWAFEEVRRGSVEVELHDVDAVSCESVRVTRCTVEREAEQPRKEFKMLARKNKKQKTVTSHATVPVHELHVQSHAQDKSKESCKKRMCVLSDDEELEQELHAQSHDEKSKARSQNTRMCALSDDELEQASQEVGDRAHGESELVEAWRKMEREAKAKSRSRHREHREEQHESEEEEEFEEERRDVDQGDSRRGRERSSRGSGKRARRVCGEGLCFIFAIIFFAAIFTLSLYGNGR